MPRSRLRKSKRDPMEPERVSRPGASPRWLAPLMITLMVFGLAWIVVFYITETQYPVPGIGTWNLVIGFGITLTGFLLTTRWR